jgi:Helicase associated domain
MKRRGKISEDRCQRLNQLGFTWEVSDDNWEALFSLLVAYRKAHGDCEVPRAWQENPRLGVWVHTLRRQKRGKQERLGELSNEQIRRLDDLGFEWNPHNSSWERMFKALADYKTSHGNCNVPISQGEDTKLGTWVSHQRRSYNKGLLNESKACRLERLGLVWKPLEEDLGKYFEALAAYKKEFGDCNVPQRWQRNPQLGAWVANQRSRKKQGVVDEARITNLNEIGFQWEISKHKHKGNN